MFFKKKEEFVVEYGTGYLIKKSEAVEKKVDGFSKEHVVYFSKANEPKWDDMVKFALGIEYFYRRMPVTEDGEPIGYVKKCLDNKSVMDEVKKVLTAERGNTVYIPFANGKTYKWVCTAIEEMYQEVNKPKKKDYPKGPKNKKK